MSEQLRLEIKKTEQTRLAIEAARLALEVEREKTDQQKQKTALRIAELNAAMEAFRAMFVRKVSIN